MEPISDATRRRVAEALAEDVGAGDRTSEWCIVENQQLEAEIVVVTPGVIAGLAAAAEVFRQLGGVEFEPLVADGASVDVGAVVVRLKGSARTVLTGERTALNFLTHLSGVATLTRRFVAAVEGTGARITDTRKTTPLWRELERAATRAGGAVNHRGGLDAMVLIKDNHLVCAGGIIEAAQRVRNANVAGLKVEIETTNLAEVREALAAGADRIMLDNMSPELVREAVAAIGEHDPRPEIEASGGVTLSNARALAEAGVDYVSVGALTHSAPALDLSLRVRSRDK